MNNTFLKRFIAGRRNILHELRDWVKIIFTKGFWAFIPVFIAVGLVYYGDHRGITEAQWETVWKSRFEIAAIYIMSINAAIFTLRIVKYKHKTDMVLWIVAIAFLCREIHFAGTSTGVYIVVAFAAVLGWYWRDEIFDELDGKDLLKAAIFCMIWSYFITIVIQRRAFSAKHLAILPDEQTVHIGLEELTEDFAHLAFVLTGIITFLYPAYIDKKKKDDNL